MTSVKCIDARQAKEWLDQNEAIIIDVREPGEYAESHIAGSTLLPVGSISLDKLPANQDKKIIIHCKMGKRGGIACEKLLAADPDLDIYNLDGGITAWVDAGFAVKR